MKKQLFANTLIYLICLVAALLCNVAVEWIILKILNVLIEVTFLVSTIVSLAVAVLTVSGVFCALVAFEAHHDAVFCASDTVWPLLLAHVLWLPVAFLFRFYPLFAGGTRHLAGLLSMGGGFDHADRIADIPLWAYLVSYAVLALISVGISCLGGKLAAAHRLSTRAELTGQNEQKE